MNIGATDNPMQWTPLVAKIVRTLIFAIHEGSAHKDVVGIKLNLRPKTEIVFAQIGIAIKVITQKTRIQPDIGVCIPFRPV